MPHHARRTEELRKGRTSLAGAWYFVTWCTTRRLLLLADDRAQTIARQTVTTLDASGDGIVLAGTIMPDHMHLLLELGRQLTLSQVIGKTKAAITRASREIQWQENFFEHRLRTTKSAEDYAFYIFMNPYTAGICHLEQTWSGWIPPSERRWEFAEKLRDGGLPQPEWIQIADVFGKALPPGSE